MELSSFVVQEVVAEALHEDLGRGDITTLAIIPAGVHADAHVVMRENGVVAGLPLLAAVFRAVDPALSVTQNVEDGTRVSADTVVAEISGSARSVLSGERVALNFVQRLSGVATLTACYVDALGGLPTRVLDTRKTTPGLRVLEKYAVRIGGGLNHRFGLDDAVLIKDNHLALLAAYGQDLRSAVQRARDNVGPSVHIEVEADTLEQVRMAVAAGADTILLDNMSPDEMREAVAMVNGRARLEASGGITLETIRAVAETGVDYVSVGALTHSARALDISLDMTVG